MHCILIVGASGAGKDSLLKAAKAYFTQCGDKKSKVHFIPRYIDRIPDQNEANFYIDTQSFEILQDFFISKWRANSHNYGIAKHCLHKDGINIISISRSAIKDFEAYCKNVSVIEVFVPLHILQTRLEQRGRENKAQIAKRLENANKKTYAKNLYRFENAKPLEESGREFVCLIENIIFGWDSALGEQCGSVGVFAEGTNAKFANLPQKRQSSHSPTAIPRILEEENQAECEKTAENKKTTNIQSVASLEKVDSRSNIPLLSLRALRQQGVAKQGAAAASLVIHNKNTQNTHALESTFENNAKKSQSKAFFEKVDSSHQAQNLNKPQATGFLKKHRLTPSGIPCFAMRKQGVAAVSLVNRGFQDRGEGSYLVGNDRDPSEESTIYRAKPTPNINNPSKVLHFLGSSDSGGIPVHNCNCNACEEYRKQGKQNLSTSAFLQTESSEYILLDCGIEATATLFDGAKIRAIFLTHFHADHALGLLRLRYSKQHIVCYHPDDKQGFGDLFKHTKSIAYQVLRPFIPIAIDSYTFTPIPLLHSKPTFGYFIQTPSENIAYLTDCAGLPQQSLEFLQQKSIDICYIDAGAFVDSNGKKDSSNHLSHYEATDIIKALAPKQARLIHISHKILESLAHTNLPFAYVV